MASDAEKAAVLQQMDKDGKLALAEFEKSMSKMDGKQVAQWWQKWYTKAGHKRLGRGLVAIAKRLA
uniref:EF-hand domain-containing protein n=1 Tax=viral metagenome TaxID=1070528 RepID=A0A6H2A4W9_9ZZZZ